MAKYKDYYKLLGVDRNASQEEIQKAYRKLARKYHPDVNKDSGSEQKYQEINEAYEVLKDPDKRQRYDNLGMNWEAGQDFSPPPGYQDFQGGHVHFGGFDGQEGFGGFSDFFNMLFGDFGFGGGRGQRGRTATFFGDEGGPSMRGGGDQEASIELTLEDAAEGGVKQIALEQPGKGRKTLEVRIPAGVTEGQKIRLAGQGAPGMDGTPGDLYLKVHLKEHPRFSLEGHNLRTTLRLAPWEAALGAEVPVKTLNGEVQMKIPAGTQGGQVFRLKGKGMPRRKGAPGDLFVAVRISLPKKLSDRERDLFEELARVSRFRPR